MLFLKLNGGMDSIFWAPQKIELNAEFVIDIASVITK